MPRFFRPLNAFFAGFFSVAICLAVTACTKPPSNGDAPTPTAGKTFYAFARENIRSFEIVRQYPGEEAWRMRLARTEDGWRIESAPAPLQYRLADGGFIDHLLDTLLTLVPFERAREGDLKSYGLDPPRALLKFGADEKSGLTLELGDESQPGIRFARFAPDTAVMLTEGATLQMLKLVTDWQFLRRKVWLMGAIDDVDVVQAGNHEYEREGLDWKKKKSGVARNVPEALQNLFHQRIKRFVDSADEDTKLTSLAAASPAAKISLIDRRDTAQTLEIHSIASGVYGRNSARGTMWFELHPEILQTFSRLTQTGSTPRKSGTK